LQFSLQAVGPETFGYTLVNTEFELIIVVFIIVHFSAAPCISQCKSGMSRRIS